jgi:queuine tRNA-ribosyltransferase
VRGLRQAVMRRQGGWGGGLFAIQQGGADPAIRGRCSDALAEHPFDGFAVGGLAVGEPPQQLHDSVAAFAPLLPADRPRYLMGVGYPEDLLHAVACGVDLFDCVLPTRSARTGKLFTSRGELNIKNTRHADDDCPPDPDCPCPTCAHYSRGALRHLFVAREATSVVLLTVHNLTFFLSLMRGAREAIIAGRYSRFRTRAELARTTEAGREAFADTEG